MLVKVTKRDIRRGRMRDCYRCPLAAALQRASKDDHAAVIEREWMLHLVVWSRYIVAPPEASAFVRAVDDGRRREWEPFTFELPELNDEEWREECYGCEQLYQPDELDDEGYCEECTEKGGA